jgi:hypothetical protein
MSMKFTPLHRLDATEEIGEYMRLAVAIISDVVPF